MRHEVSINPIVSACIKRSRRARGSILILAMVVSLTLAVVVLSLCRTMAVEARVSANHAALLQASTIARGAEQYVLALLADQGAAAMDLTEDYYAAVPIGDGFFWILRPHYDDGDDFPLFGLVDECSKIDINRANRATLLRLPGMTEDIAAAMIDWRDSNENTTSYGAESDYYMSLPDPYLCKNAPFETVEELLLVRDVTQGMLYGDGSAAPLGSNDVMVSSGRLSFTSGQIARGLFDVLTVHAFSPPASGGGSRSRGRVNVNTAPRDVLLCVDGMDEARVDRLLSARKTETTMGATTMQWASSVLGMSNQQMSERFTGQSYRYSADILAVSRNGRAYKRVRIVVDTANTTTGPQIIYRRDLTDRGWPMDVQVLAELRSGAALQQTGTMNSLRGGVQR